MRAFFDESGLNPREDKALIMGGLLGSIEEWERTSDAWDKCLHEHPKVEYFKSDEAKNLSGQFERFSHDSADEKKKSLARVIGQSSLQGFCAAVHYRWFENRDPKATKGVFGARPYDWAFITATKVVLQYMRDNHSGEKVDFIFDQRTELSSCIPGFYELKSLEDCPWSALFDRAGTVTPGDDMQVSALQMADLLAGEFSAVGNRGNQQSEAWKLIALPRPIVYSPCNMPSAIPLLVALQGEAKQIKDVLRKILKRIYGDKERTSQLSAECDDLIAKQIRYEAAINTLVELHEADEGFRRFQDIMLSRDGNK